MKARGVPGVSDTLMSACVSMIIQRGLFRGLFRLGLNKSESLGQSR